MELIEALRTRRSIKSYTATSLSRETLLEILDIARYSPSGNNKNNFQFVVTTHREAIDKLSQVHQFCKWLGSAQSAIAIIGNPSLSRYWLEDCCLAAYSIYLGALAKGVGVAWSAIYQSDSPTEDERRQSFVRQLFSVPGKLKVPIVLGLGYPQDPPAPRKMATLEELVSWEKYGQQ